MINEKILELANAVGISGGGYTPVGNILSFKDAVLIFSESVVRDVLTNVEARLTEKDIDEQTLREIVNLVKQSYGIVDTF